MGMEMGASAHSTLYSYCLALSQAFRSSRKFYVIFFEFTILYTLYPALSDLVMNRDEYRTEEHTVLLYTHFLSS